MSYCPTCGKDQGHIHLGWLSLDAPITFKDCFTEKGIPKTGILFTEIVCEYCSVKSVIVRYMPEQTMIKLKELEEVIRSVFNGKE